MDLVHAHKTKAFLAALRKTCNVSRAAEAAGIDRHLHYKRLKKDPHYQYLVAEALAEGAQTLEDAAVERAVNGVLRTKYWQGAPCGMEMEYSDSLLMFLLKAAKPQKYRENFKVEHTGPNDGPISVESTALTKLSDNELASLIALTRKLAEPGVAGGGTPPPEAQPDR